MSIRFQQLHTEVFEERAMPSVNWFSLSNPAPTQSALRSEQSLFSARQETSHIQTFNYGHQTFALVPLWLGRNGGMTYLLVNVTPANPYSAYHSSYNDSQAITQSPVSQRQGAQITREEANRTVENTASTASVKATARASASNNRDDLVSFIPERSTTLNARESVIREQAANNAAVQTTQPPVIVAANQGIPALRDYSLNTMQEEFIRVTMPASEVQPAIPQTAEPPLATVPTEPEAEATLATVLSEQIAATMLTPLAGLLPFNSADLENEAKNLLSSVANFGADVAEEITSSSEYVWLAAAALAAGGAVMATRPSKSNKGVANGLFASWEEKNAG